MQRYLSAISYVTYSTQIALCRSPNQGPWRSNRGTEARDAITIEVGVVISTWAHVTEVSESVSVSVQLGQILSQGAVVTGVINAVPISVGRIRRAGVTRVRQAVTILIDVVIAGQANVADIAVRVTITVVLSSVGHRRTVVAGVRHQVRADVNPVVTPGPDAARTRQARRDGRADVLAIWQRAAVAARGRVLQARMAYHMYRLTP